MEKEYNKGKALYLIFIFFVYVIVLWAMIDGLRNNLPITGSITYYIMLSTILGLAPIGIDIITPGKYFAEIATTTFEEPRHKLLGGKMQIGIAIVLMFVLGWQILVTNTAFIPYPSFQIFEGKIAGAVMSGLFGVMEDWVFFGFLFTTILGLLESKLGKGIALVPAIIVIGVLFMGYHVFVYSASQHALIAVFMFAVLSSSMTYFFRSLIVSNALHGVNNFVAFLINAKVFFLF